jgi:nucleoside-diphosphate-sugar epimerase
MLIAKAHEVVGLDSDLFERCTFGDGIQNIPELKKDIRDVEVADLDGFDAVIHLAGLSNDPLGDLNPELTYEINHAASVRLASWRTQTSVPPFSAMPLPMVYHRACVLTWYSII